jgi:SulP family sulfate permease
VPIEPGTVTLRSLLTRDLPAGLSVALILIPQSLAYAELAGLPGSVGLTVAALTPLAAALFASSPYLQTGPTALTSLLTLGVLSTLNLPGTSHYVASAALLALLTGLIRAGLGFARLGALSYFMSLPVLRGFTSAAALLIILTQLPAAFGASGSGGITGAAVLLVQPGTWQLAALGFTLLTIALLQGAKLVSPRLPGALLAVAAGISLSSLFDYQGATVGQIGAALPLLNPDLPWLEVPQLALGAFVIAIVGFAEPASIARQYAHEVRGGWNPNRELISQGLANFVAGLFSGFPVGGSFSRSALNRASGAASRWSGFFTGLAVLAFLPAAGLLRDLPTAVLAAIVIGSVTQLLQLRGLLRLWRYARLQGLIALTTFTVTLLLAPRVDYAVIIGISLAISVHLYREMKLDISSSEEDGRLTIRLAGVLWFGSTHLLEAYWRNHQPLQAGVTELHIDAAALGRIDLSGTLLINELLAEAEEHGRKAAVSGLDARVRSLLGRVRTVDSDVRAWQERRRRPGR